MRRIRRSGAVAIRAWCRSVYELRKVRTKRSDTSILRFQSPQRSHVLQPLPHCAARVLGARELRVGERGLSRRVALTAVVRRRRYWDVAKGMCSSRIACTLRVASSPPSSGDVAVIHAEIPLSGGDRSLRCVEPSLGRMPSRFDDSTSNRTIQAAKCGRYAKEHTETVTSVDKRS